MSKPVEGNDEVNEAYERAKLAISYPNLRKAGKQYTNALINRSEAIKAIESLKTRPNGAESSSSPSLREKDEK